MRKSKKHSVDMRQRIINFHKLGNSYSSISNWLAIPRFLVQSIIKKFKQFGMTENLPGWKRKAKLSLRTACKLCSEVNVKPRIILKDITKSLDTTGISVSCHTMQHCLNRNGLYGKWP